MSRRSSVARLDEGFVLRARPPGSARDLVVRFAPTELRPGLTALFALQAEVLSLSRAATDHDVAHSRLEWWRGELQRLIEGEPRHPVTRALQAEIASRPVDVRALPELLAAAEWELARLTVESTEEFERLCWRSQGVVQHVGLQLGRFAHDAPGIEDFARDVGYALGVERALLSLESDARRGLVSLPLQELNTHGVTLEDLRSPAGSSARRAYVRSLCASALERSCAARQRLDPATRAAARAHIVLASLCEAQLAHCREAASRGTTECAELSPLKRLWTAWNAARRAGAHA